MELPSIPYHFVENFIDEDYCDLLLDHLTKNKEEDPRSNFNGYGIGGKRDFIGLEQPIPRDWDPENKIHEFVNFAYNFFKDNYPMVGEFELNRVHGNFMWPTAVLEDHFDDRSPEPGKNKPEDALPIDVVPHRTHVCGLFLTDDYEGGETCFPEYGIEIKPKKGSLYFFPGYFTIHGVKEVKNGHRVNILAQFFDVIDRDNMQEQYKNA